MIAVELITAMLTEFAVVLCELLQVMVEAVLIQ